MDWTKLAKVAEGNPDVVPVAVQDIDTKDLLVLAYVNEQALEHTFKSGNATFWSTSRQELWEKGATSGETFEIIDVRVNCEQNSLLYLVRPRRGGMCHTKDCKGHARVACYYRQLDPEKRTLTNLNP